MPFAIAHCDGGEMAAAIREAVQASGSTLRLVDDLARADVLVFTVTDSASLMAAGEAHRRYPDAQLVLLAPAARVPDLRLHLPFIPRMASAWTVETSASSAALAEVLGKAASVSNRRKALHHLREKINRQLHSAGSAHDAEHQRQRQIALSEGYLATLLAQAPQAFIAVTPEGEITAWNATAEILCGTPATKAIGCPLTEVLPQAAAAKLLQMAKEILETDAAISREMKLELAPAKLWAEVSAAPVHEGAHVLCVSITIQDVSDRHRAIAMLRASESRYRSLTEALPQLVWTARPDGSAEYFNHQWLEYTGMDASTQQGMGWLDRVVHPEDRERTRTQWLGAVQGRHPYDVEYRIRGADGNYRWFKTRGLPIRDEHDAITEWLGTATDIEDIVRAREALQQNAARLSAMVEKEMQHRFRAEAALHRALKMEAIGNLTGGIAHDFNNILQVVGGNLHLLATRMPDDEVVARRIADALDGVARGSKLASQLLAFGRRLPLAPKVVNIGRLVREMDDMLRRSLGEGVELETAIAGGLWNTLVDRSNIESALLNLAINARDAMDGSGRLTIEVGNAFLDQDYADAHEEVSPGQYVMLAVTDTGCGMPPELAEKVFEPFFSTKPEGKGTGLGLSMVYGFVRQSAGHIKIYSELGQGTTFKIYLPRSREAEDVLVSDERRPVRGGSETVLVVEDDDAVREIAVTTLAELGYPVLKARDAKAALSIIESGAHIDLLFTDVVMPGPLKSTELVRKARDRLPHLAVLYTSGYTQNAIVHHGRLDDGVELLSKPYSREALARKIRHVLANRQQADAGMHFHTVAPAATSAGAPTLLLCEDELMIRQAVGELLEAKGFNVLLAGSGREALEIGAGQSFDLLVTDLGLPDMSGMELARRVRETHPGCPVLIASGTLQEPRDGLADAHFIAKPFGADELHEAVLAALRTR